MNSILNNAWTVSFVAGVASSVIGGLILAAITNSRQGYGYYGTGEEAWRLILRVILYGIAVAVITAVILVVYRTGGLSGLAPFEEVLAFAVWLFGAVYGFGVLVLGWQVNAR